MSFIQTELPSAEWRHVSSKENSADLATHGVKPDELKGIERWWHVPKSLSLPAEDWPNHQLPKGNPLRKLKPVSGYPSTICWSSGYLSQICHLGGCSTLLQNFIKRLPPFLLKKELTGHSFLRTLAPLWWSLGIGVKSTKHHLRACDTLP